MCRAGKQDDAHGVVIVAACGGRRGGGRQNRGGQVDNQLALGLVPTGTTSYSTGGRKSYDCAVRHALVHASVNASIGVHRLCDVHGFPPLPIPLSNARPFVFRPHSKKRSSRVFAFDKDPRRLALMRRRVDEAGGGAAIETHLQDFLEVDAADERFSRVTTMLLDPSCSGSGIVSAPDRLHENQGVDGGGEGEEKSRVGRLAAFQLQGLLKAMSFTQVTCCFVVLLVCVL